MKKGKGLFSALLVMALGVSLSIPAHAGDLGQAIKLDSNSNSYATLTNIDSRGTYKKIPVYYATAHVGITFIGDDLKREDVGLCMTSSHVMTTQPGKESFYTMENLAYWDVESNGCYKSGNNGILTGPGMYAVLSGRTASDSFSEREIDCYIVITGTEMGVTKGNPTTSTVLVDGKRVSFDAYNIDGYNYFKLRDVAKALNGSKKQFNVSWDAANARINMDTGREYESVGGELVTGNKSRKQAIPSHVDAYINSTGYGLETYNIDGNNFLMLRGIASIVDFAVTWDAATNSINIDTSKAYTP